MPKGTRIPGIRGSFCSFPTAICIPQHQRMHPDVAGHLLAQPPSPSHPFSQLCCAAVKGQRANSSQFIFHRYVFLPALPLSNCITAVITLHLRQGALYQDPGRGKNQSQNSFLSASTWQSPALGLVTKSIKTKQKLFLPNHHPNSKQQWPT